MAIPQKSVLQLRLINVYLTLSKDVEQCMREIRGVRTWDGTPTDIELFWHRMYVRSVYALIEGAIYAMKQYAFAMNELLDTSVFDEDEILLLQDTRYSKAASGERNIVSAKTPLKENVRFAFNAVSRILNNNYTLSTKDEGWNHDDVT